MLDSLVHSKSVKIFFPIYSPDKWIISHELFFPPVHDRVREKSPYKVKEDNPHERQQGPACKHNKEKREKVMSFALIKVKFSMHCIV
jgi:hypothetical protein